MSEDSRGARIGKVLVVFAVLGVLGWFLHGEWVKAACPGREEVLAEFLDGVDLPDEEGWDAFGLVACWADEEGGRPIEVGEWEFRAGQAYLRPGGSRRGLKTEERYVMAFHDREGESGAGDHYFLVARPNGFFAKLRIYWHEFGDEMGTIESKDWARYETWVAPDR